MRYIAITITLLVFATACGDSGATTTQPADATQVTTTDAGASPLPSTRDAALNRFGDAWIDGDFESMEALADASVAAEASTWGQAETFGVVACATDGSGSESCELLVGVDGIGLLFRARVDETAAGFVIVDLEFAGDAG